MGNPFLDRLKTGIGIPGRKSEKRVAKAMGARLHPGSGAPRGAKSDATLQDFRMEMKATTADSLRLEMGWLNKIADEAISHGQKPGLVISFINVEGKARMPLHGEWVAIPMNVFRELLK